MTKEETQKTLAVILASYPQFKPEKMQFTLNVWHEMLKDYDYKVVSAGLKTYIATDTSGFAPSIGQLIDSISKLKTIDEMNEIQAWHLVSEALRDGYYHSKERFDALPPLIQQAVGSHEVLRNWSQTDERSVETVIASNFQRTYRTLLNRSKEMVKLPADVVAMIESNKALKIEEK